MELMSKREGNCNVMITGPADHGLHATTMSSSLYRLIITTILSPSYQLNYKSALALSRTQVLCVAYMSNKKFALIVGSQKLLTDQCLFGNGQI